MDKQLTEIQKPNKAKSNTVKISQGLTYHSS